MFNSYVVETTNMLLGESLIYSRIPFKKLLRLFELRTDISSLFHQILVKREKRNFGKFVYKVKTWVYC